jgi:signal peptidase I
MTIDALTLEGLSAEILSRGSALRLQVQGGSMAPLIQDEDILTLEPVNFRKISVGDAILFKSPQGNLVIHRVIRKKSFQNTFQFLVQGDQVANNDGWIAGEQVFGKVTQIERGQRFLNGTNFAARIINWWTAQRLRTPLLRSRFIKKIQHLVQRIPFFARYIE